jgi:flagellar biosynthetic protein FliR
LNLLDLTAVQFQAFLLYFLRGAGFLFVAPVVSARSVPSQFKVALAGGLALMFLALNQPALPARPYETAVWAPMAVGELIIGLAVGFLVGLIYVVFEFAGRIFGFQMGFGIVNVLDPQSQEEVSLTGEFLFTIVSLAILNLNLHHAFLLYWGRSFELVPAGGIDAAGFSIEAFGGMLTTLFVVALQIAAPLLAILFMLDFGLGIIARVVPQINVFLVGIPLKIAGGLFVMAMVVGLLNPVVWRVVDKFLTDAMSVVTSFG